MVVNYHYDTFTIFDLDHKMIRKNNFVIIFLLPASFRKWNQEL